MVYAAVAFSSIQGNFVVACDDVFSSQWEILVSSIIICKGWVVSAGKRWNKLNNRNCMNQNTFPLLYLF